MYTLQQARAKLVAVALFWLGRSGIVFALRQNGSFPRPGDDLRSTRALAWRLAWRILPAMSSCLADLGSYAGEPTPDCTPEVK